MKQLFTISEFGKHHGISRRTLLHYDHIGLLHPYKKDENGYRYYAAQQHTELAAILTLKELGISLEHIQQILATRNPLLLRNIYMDLLKKTDYQIALLTKTRSTLTSRLDKYDSLDGIVLQQPMVQLKNSTTYTFVELPSLDYHTDLWDKYGELSTNISIIDPLDSPNSLDGEPWGFVLSENQQHPWGYRPSKLIKRIQPLPTKNAQTPANSFILTGPFLSAFTKYTLPDITKSIHLIKEYSVTNRLTINQSEPIILLWKDAIDTPTFDQHILEICFPILSPNNM